MKNLRGKKLKNWKEEWNDQILRLEIRDLEDSLQ